jgi:hypothetical protein
MRMSLTLFSILFVGSAAAQNDPRINGLTHSEMLAIQENPTTVDCSKIQNGLGKSRCEEYLTTVKRCPGYRWAVDDVMLEKIKASPARRNVFETQRMCEALFRSECVGKYSNEGILNCEAAVSQLGLQQRNKDFEAAHKQDNELAHSERVKFDACRVEHPSRDRMLDFNNRLEGDRMQAELTITSQTQALKDDEEASKISGVSNTELRQGAGLLIVQARRTLDELMSTYRSLGGTANSPDEIKAFSDPCGSLIPQHQETHVSCGKGFGCDDGAEKN